MDSHPTDIARSLSQKFQALHDAFNALATEAANFHNSVPITDKNERGLFNSLSRIVAFSDHVHVALNLMGEDVQAIEATYGNRAAIDLGDMDDCFDEWFRQMSLPNAKVH